MYGGMDRSSVPDLKIADDKLISDASKQFGGRERAATVWIEQGFKLQRQDKPGLAMRRFNQAWLLDPVNPEVFHGFAAVLYDGRDNCGAMQMSQRALSLGLDTSDFLADAALVFSLCAVDPQKPAGLDRASLLKRSDELFAAASGRIDKTIYVHDKWSQALYWRGEYEEAWEKVTLMRTVGGRPHEAYLRELRAKMPEPGR